MRSLNPTREPDRLARAVACHRNTWPLLLLGTLTSAIVAVPIGTGGYGLFNDEFYYVACAKRLAWGFVDHPPFAPALLRLVRLLLGHGVLSLRLPAAIAIGTTVFTTGLLSRRMGGGLFAQMTAALCCAATPVFLVPAGFFSMNPFKTLLWALAFLILVEIEQRQQPRLWLALGVISGIGLMNKHTFVLLALGLFAGMVSTRARRHFKSGWLWSGTALAGLIIAPNLAWQLVHDWPSLEFYHNAYIYKNIVSSPFQVLLTQILAANPATLPVWAAGLYYLLGSQHGKPFRHLGLIYPILLASMVVSQSSRPDRIASCFTLLFAAGAVQLETALRASRWTRQALIGTIVAFAVALLPISIPILPIETAGRYAAVLGTPRTEKSDNATAPLWFSGRLGWPSLVDDVRAVVTSLDRSVRPRTAIVTSHYGYAGAVEYYAPELAPVFSVHNNYFLWGPPPSSTRLFVLVGFQRRRLEAVFAQVALARENRCNDCPRYRRKVPIWIARSPKLALTEAWKRARTYH